MENHQDDPRARAVSAGDCPNGCGKLDAPTAGVKQCPVCLFTDFGGGDIVVERPDPVAVRDAIRAEGASR